MLKFIMSDSLLTKLVLLGLAESGSYALGGSALSSIPLEAGETFIVTGVQIFPFFDISEDLETDPNENWRFSAAGVHFFEFSTLQQRQGLIHRSVGENVPGLAVPPVPGYKATSGADFFPVLWVFRPKTADFLVNRVSRLLSPAETGSIPNANTIGTESANVLGYDPAALVVNAHDAFGFSSGQPITWVMDARQGIIAPVGQTQVSQPRPQGDATNPALDNALRIPSLVQNEGNPYLYPFVNINYVRLKKGVKLADLL